jgi:hypothetical protein
MYLFGKRFVNCDTKSVRKFSRMYWKFTSGCRIAILQLVVELFYKYQHWLQHGYKWLGHDPELRRQVISFRQALVRKTAWLDVEFFEQDITEAHTNHSTIFVQRKCVDAIYWQEPVILASPLQTNISVVFSAVIDMLIIHLLYTEKSRQPPGTDGEAGQKMSLCRGRPMRGHLSPSAPSSATSTPPAACAPLGPARVRSRVRVGGEEEVRAGIGNRCGCG